MAALQQEAARASLNEFVQAKRGSSGGRQVWVALSAMALNGVAGFERATSTEKCNSAQLRAFGSLQASVTRALQQDFTLKRSAHEAEKELASRHLTYTGEVVPTMQVIGLRQIEAALPPATHGGSIDALKFVSPGTQKFLAYPEDSRLEVIPTGHRLQSKVHIKKGEELAVCRLLAERHICTWVPLTDVVEVHGTKVLIGLFAVGKGSCIESGEEIQRVIMNLVPTNGLFRQLHGSTKDLPAISQYLGLILDGSEEVQLFQSDMSAAFYLFKIPDPWSRAMSFNIGFDGSDIGLQCGVRYQLACSVVPMGWSSSVSVMQEIADRLTVIARLPQSHQVRRTAPLPQWMVETLDESSSRENGWFHVYLGNFRSMRKVSTGSRSRQGEDLHTRLEEAWTSSGVLSSAKKRVSGAQVAVELGAELDGKAGSLGVSLERLLKLIQTTLVVLGKRILRKKWLQIVAGRWVHVLTFRRPGMVTLEDVWKFIARPHPTKLLELKVRGLCLGAMLLNANLRASTSGVTTCSDASSTGGAVGLSRSLTLEGKQFAAMDLHRDGKPTQIPVMVLSLFNGVGCTFRCYDLCGVIPQVGIAYELNRAANRVTSRRWPWVIIECDVCSLNEEKVRQWRYQYPEITEIHIWGGFPRVDLSSVRARRLNLRGPSSGLFWEFIRILKLIRQIFGIVFPVKFICENVASMDPDAELEIARALGTKPFRVDSADSVPIHRPRFCWRNLDIDHMEGASLEEKPRWVEVSLPHAYPKLDQWLEPGAVWAGASQGLVFPTRVKSLPRAFPPERPAGLNRVSWGGRLRWEADQHRFPP